MPQQLLDGAQLELDSKRLSKRPDKILRKLHDNGTVKQHGDMQLISTVTKNIDANDTFKHHRIAHHMDVPSLLHVIDKTDLTKCIITKTNEDEKNEGYLSRMLAKESFKYKNGEQVEKELRDIFMQ